MSVGRPQTDGDLLADILRRLADLERSAQAGHTSIGAGGMRVLDGGEVRIEGGQLVITDANGDVQMTLGEGLSMSGLLELVDGGSLEFKDDAAAKIVKLGDVTFGAHVSTGFLLIDPSGQVRVGFYEKSPGGGHVFEVYGVNGFTAISLDKTYGGLDHPQIPYIWREPLGTAARSTTSATFETLWECRGYFQHPNVYLSVQAVALGGAEGEVRLWDALDSVVIGGPEAFAIGGAGLTKTLSGLLPDPSDDIRTYRTLEIQARVTNGTGSVEIEPRSSYGTAST